MALAFYSPNGTHDATFIGNYVNLYVKDALARVKGVGISFPGPMTLVCGFG